MGQKAFDDGEMTLRARGCDGKDLFEGGHRSQMRKVLVQVDGEAEAEAEGDAYREEDFNDFEIADAASYVQRGIGCLPVRLCDGAVFQQ